ncbi:MAG TPA: hypothetical protein VG387_12800 [Rhizomicrobium sp.]|nr:hypothetical protein [Rhizomicrobium sp.]
MPARSFGCRDGRRGREADFGLGDAFAGRLAGFFRGGLAIFFAALTGRLAAFFFVFATAFVLCGCVLAFMAMTNMRFPPREKRERHYQYR